MKRITILLLISSIFMLALSSFVPQTSKPNGELVVIINNANPVTAMTASQVKLTYLRKINKRWKELNKNILPVERKGDNEIKKSFLKDILQMTNDELARYFTEREYQNAEAPPVKFATEDEIVDYVENNVGAIGYVSKSSVKAGSKVKIVLSL